MAQLFANAARTKLVRTALSTDATLYVESYDRFPWADGIDWFYATLQDSDGIEIVKVVQSNTYMISPGNPTVAFEVERGQQDTVARDFDAGTVVGLRPTAEDMRGALGVVASFWPGESGDYIEYDHIVTREDFGKIFQVAPDDMTSERTIKFTNIPGVPLGKMVVFTPVYAFNKLTFTAAGTSWNITADGVAVPSKILTFENVTPGCHFAFISSSSWGLHCFMLPSRYSPTVDALRDIVGVVKTGAYALALTDRGGSIDTSASVTVPANATVAFPPNKTTVMVTNTSANAITLLAATGVTLRLAGTATTGNRTIAGYGVATLRKIATDTWLVAGAGVT